jgi:hypothetical protein
VLTENDRQRRLFQKKWILPVQGPGVAILVRRIGFSVGDRR